MFDFLKDAAVRRILGSLVRTGLAALGGLLVERGLADQADVDSVALRAAPIVLAALWSLYQKVQQHKREKVALAMPPTATTQDVTAAIKAGADG